MLWLLEREIFADGDQALADAATAAGGQVLFWRDDWWEDHNWPKQTPVPTIFHGSLANADRIARELPWVPGSYCNTSAFAYSVWWPQVSDQLVSATYELTTVAKVVTNGPRSIAGERVFIRPDSALKPFSGRVLDHSAITYAGLDHGFYYEDINLPVIVTPVVDVTSEWRFVVVDGQVVAGSAYLADGRSAGETITEGHPAWAYAANTVKRLTPPQPAFVLDVCETPGGLKLLELNPLSGADLYNCDRAAIVDAIQHLPH